MDIVSYAKSKKYTDETVIGLGALQGAPCTVESAEHDDTNHKTDLVLGWEGTDGTHKTKNVPIPDGVGIESIEKTSTVGNIDTYTITLTDGTTTTFTITNADGIPVGGTTGQVLMKNSNTDGDVKWGDSTGIGDMRKAVYDTNQNGIVDNAEKVNNHTVDKDVPSDAKFTDTVYDDTEVRTAINGKVDKTSVGANSGVASLDANGKVPASELPSFVDDVVEGYYDSTTDRFYEESAFTTVIPPVEGKSWVDIPANKSYRWTGSVYVRVDEGVQIGETSDTAFRGDHGKVAYDDSQTNKSDIANMKNGVAIDSFGDVETALEGKVDAEQGKGLSTNDYTTNEKNKLAGLENVQTSVMPVASSENVGDVVQYVGSSVSGSYQHGYFYECKAQGTDPETYAWEQTDVQPSSASSGHTIENSAGTDLTQRNTLQFKGGLRASDDSTNGKTVIDDIVPEIEWSVWNAMTPQEQAEYPNAIILNAPDGEGGSEDIEAIVNVYGSKNLNVFPYRTTTMTDEGITFTDNGDGTITVNGTATADTGMNLHDRSDRASLTTLMLNNNNYILTGCPEDGSADSFYIVAGYGAKSTNSWFEIGKDVGNGLDFTINGDYYSDDSASMSLAIIIKSGTTVNNLTFRPMIRDARISDSTYVPYAMTNKDLTDNKASKADLSSIRITGTTNNTGNTITAGTFFYLNGEYVRAKVDIANNATFTLNTNYEKKPVGDVLANAGKPTSSLFELGGAFYCKFGKTVIAFFDAHSETTRQITANSTILFSGFPSPTSQVSILGYKLGNTDTIEQLSMGLKTTGEVVSYTNETINGYKTIHAVFMYETA